MTNSSTAARMRRTALTLSALAASGALLAGCLAGPTYGTDKGSNEQLLEDISGMLSVAPKNETPIEYKPRPELVKPANVAGAPLPAPQDPIATASNPAWPEAPEAQRARMRAEATAFRDEPDFEPQIGGVATRSEPRMTVLRTRGDDVPLDGKSNDPRNQRADFNKRMAMSNQGSPTQRRFLSEPPLDYRAPAATAPVGDVGEDEWKKERAAKRAARKKGTGGIRDLLPW